MAERIYSIDAMRIVAMVFVVAIHTDPFRGLGVTGNALNFVIDSTARFAVPFFFLVSGYFFALKTADRDATSYVLDRVTTIGSIYVFGLSLVMPVFLAGTAVRASLDGRDIVASTTDKLAEFLVPIDLLYYGDSVSVILWFLPALAFSLAFIYLFATIGAERYLIPASLGPHVVGLLGASYTMFIDVPFEVRDALFFGFFYTSLGYVIAARGWQPSPDRSGRYLAATVLFAVAHVGERYVLGYVLTGETIAESIYVASYTIGTVLVTVSLFGYLLARPTLGESTALPSWGKYAVGVYVVHPAVLYVLELGGDLLESGGYAVLDTIAWHLFLTPATFFGSLFVYLAAHKWGVVELGGSHLPSLPRIRNAD